MYPVAAVNDEEYNGGRNGVAGEGREGETERNIALVILWTIILRVQLIDVAYRAIKNDKIPSLSFSPQ